MKLIQLRQKRADLLREAEGFKGADGTFSDDQVRRSFDAKMAEVEAQDALIRAAEAEEATERVDSGDAVKVAERAIANERTRSASINELARRHSIDSAAVESMITRGVSVDVARAEVLEALTKRQASAPTGGHVAFGEDARDKWIRGAAAWLLVRSGMAGIVAKHDGTTVDKIEPGEFRGFGLLDLARESLTRAGVNTRGMDKQQLAGQAMVYRSNYQTTSDFATLLENVTHKILRAGYAITPDTWSKFCGVASVSDFRAHNWYKWGSLSQLDTLTEQGEFKNKSIPDAEKATFTATTKGNIIAISRQVIVNDDLSAVTRLTEMLGRAAKLTIEKAVYTLLALNSGDGPTLSDSVAMFHTSSHGANKTTGAALSAAALDLDRIAMASQLDPNSQEYTDLRPAVLVVPIGLGGQARVINGSQYDPDTLANKSQMKLNISNGLFREIVDTPRITGTRRYLFADPAIAPVIVVSFLDGQQEPVLETQDGWRVDGVEMKARLDFGVDGVDYRGAVTNAGA